MSEIVCEKCSIKLDIWPFTSVPKILKCSHIICTKCFFILMNGKGNCPVCETEAGLPEGPFLSDLTKFAITSNSPQFLNVIFEMNYEYVTEFFHDVEDHLKSFVFAMSNLEKLQKEGSYDAELMRINNYFNVVFSKFQNLKKKISLNQEIDIKSYRNDKDIILSKLMDRLAKGEKIYAKGNVDEEMKYGKVTLKGNGIFVNALTLSEKEEESAYFWLSDFKKHFHDKICCFLTFPSNERTADDDTYNLVFDINDCQKNSGFFELCTGETRNSFKGASYVSAGEDAFELKIARNYATLSIADKRLEIIKGDIILRNVFPEMWEIKRVKNNIDVCKIPLRTIVGKLKTDVSFKVLDPNDPSAKRIKDSGLAIFSDYVNSFYVKTEE